jgi:hypothetical protein
MDPLPRTADAETSAALRAVGCANEREVVAQAVATHRDAGQAPD